MSLPRFILGRPWCETQAEKLAEDDQRRLHTIRAACRTLQKEFHGEDWFSSVSHDAKYQRIYVNTVNDEGTRHAIERWCGFPVYYRQQT